MKEYNAITYTGDKSQGNAGFVKFRKISSKDRHIKFISEKFPLWRFITFYDRETNDKEIIKNPGLKCGPGQSPGAETPRTFFPPANVKKTL